MAGVVAERAELDRALARRAGARWLVADIELFGEVTGAPPLRPYQSRVARTVLESIAARQGLTITVMMVPKGYGHLRAACRTA